MKTQDSISTSKTGRAIRFAGTGIKIGGNYLKHYAKKLVNPDLEREALHRDNAADIYETLSHLKGSALKVAQMLSMDRGMLPKAYSDKFSLSQYNAPPLSAPLVMRTFQKYFGKSPQQLFDIFEAQAANAASMGQVHFAEKEGRKLAVKIQYPGVADSVKSDLRLVKPFALKLTGLSERETNKYFEEVEAKLLEETDYTLELRCSEELSRVCSHIPDLVFPKYYPELSSEKIITMDRLEGLHLKEFLRTNPSQDVRNRVGQALWNFYDYQIHQLKKVHADPHPGNFLFRQDGTVGIIDFGCVKEIPEDFYRYYFSLIDPSIRNDEKRLYEVYLGLEMLFPDDTPQEQRFFSELFGKLTDMLTLPFTKDTFDFGDEAYFREVYAYSDYVYGLKEIKESRVARGSRHSLYINRTYFGLYSILADLKAKIKTRKVLSFTD